MSMGQPFLPMPTVPPTPPPASNMCQQLAMQFIAASDQGKMFAAAKQKCLEDIALLDPEIQANRDLQLQIAGQMNSNGCNLP